MGLLFLILMSNLYAMIFCGQVDLKIFEIDSAVSDIIFCGSNHEIIFVLTEVNSVYRSSNKGFTWTKLNDILHAKGMKELEPDESEIGKVSKMLLSPVDKSLVIFLGTHGINWICNDCGNVGFKALNHGKKIQEYIFHPTERNWGLASAFTLCEDFKTEPCRIYKELFVTKDLGQTWVLIASYVVQFSWGIDSNNVLNNKNVIPKERILMTHEPRGKGNQKTAGWNYKIDFVYSDDFFKTTKVGVYKGNKFLLTKDYLFLAQVIDQEAQEVILLVANSNENVYNFHPIDLNMKKFREHSYTFLDTSANSVFLHVNHFGAKSRFGHIYISDYEGLKYSPSIDYNIRSGDGQCDFDKVNGLEGIYISNVIDSTIMEQHKQELTEDYIEEEESLTDKAHKKAQTHFEELKAFTKTFITFNKGGKWQKLKYPEKDINGKPITCKDCHLHLHGISGNYPPFYSVESSTGIILGNGNIGKYLASNVEEISTFLSRDGGLSWLEVRKGPHIYEIGDYGGLIVMAETLKSTDKILYSYDEGETFQELSLNNKILVKNIIIEPTSTRQHFVIYGETLFKNGEKKGILVGIDFNSLSLPLCRNSEQPNTPNSDYEIWTPNDGRSGHECLMGTRTIYVRRKRKGKCFNGINFERKKTIEQCQCTEDDYECDYGFSREKIGDPCTQVKNNNETLITKPPQICFSYYTISKGYRKVPGNQCVGGVIYDPIIIPCPNTGLFSSIGLIIFLIVFAILIVLIITAFNKNFLNNVSEIVNNNNKSNSTIKNRVEGNTIKSEPERQKLVRTDYIDIEKSEEENFDDHMLFENEDELYNGTLRIIDRNRNKNL